MTTPKTFGRIALFVIVLLTVQTSFLPLLAIYGTSPDLLLLVTTSTAFLRGRRIGAFVGFSLGLLTDLATGTYFGMHTLTFLFVGYLIGCFSRRVLEEKLFLPIAAAVLVTPFVYFVFFLLMVFVFGYQLHILYHIEHTFLVMLLYQVVFSYPVHVLVRRFDKYLFTEKPTAS